MSTGIFPPPSFVSTQVAGSLGAREPAYLAGSPGPHRSLVEVPARRPPPAAQPADPRPPPPPRPTRHSLEQCRNSKRRCAPRNLSTGIGSFSSSAQRGPLLWYSTKERYSPAGGSPEPKEMTSCGETRRRHVKVLPTAAAVARLSAGSPDGTAPGTTPSDPGCLFLHRLLPPGSGLLILRPVSQGLLCRGWASVTRATWALASRPTRPSSP